MALTVAQVVTTAAGAVSYPLDSVRRRMMMQAGAAAPLYAGQLDCVRHVLAHEGAAGFYRGYGANLLRGLGGALILVLYDEVRPALYRGLGHG